jgi:diacylglycerol kinase family enzyme
VSVHDVAEMVLTATRPLPLQVDGDDLGDTDRVVLRAVPQACASSSEVTERVVFGRSEAAGAG